MISIIEQAIKNIKQQLQESVEVSTKSDRYDLVTNVDKDTEEFIKTEIRKKYPNSKILGEEGDHDVELSKGEVWIIDPIDGTANFVKQQDHFGMLIAHSIDGDIIEGYMVDVMNERIYSAIKGQGCLVNGKPFTLEKKWTFRDCFLSYGLNFLNKVKDVEAFLDESFGQRYQGSSCLDSIEVCRGNLGAYICTKCNIWDYAPQLLFAKELGLVVKTLCGQDKQMDDNHCFIIGQPAVVEEILTYL